MIKTWRVDAATQTLVLASFDGALAEILYWGATLPRDEDCAALAAQSRQYSIGAMLDEVAPLNVCPNVGEPGLIARGTDGAPLSVTWRFLEDESNEDGWTLTFEDAALGLIYRLNLSSRSGIFETHAELESKAPIHLDWLSTPAVPAPLHSEQHITFGGRWCQEFQRQITPWSRGQFVNAAPGGRTSHEYFPGIFIPASGTDETKGEAWGAHLAWSGGHRLIAEELPDGRRQIQFGHNGPQTDSNSRTPTLLLSYSENGLSGVSQNYHQYLREQVLSYPADPVRPVHYNCWEAVYFDHDPQKLMDLATQAADLGVERFVLDDGWFGKRNDDSSSLGDWQVDLKKWPDGLDPFIDHVQGLGMSFGLWFEPEMINEDSDLYRAHPDWVLGPTDQVRGRSQLVLDISKAEVRTYLLEAISSLLKAHAICYIKLDHNRPLPLADPAQTHGTYELLDALRARHPKLEIETCASGGGRVDFEILKRTHRFWTSDSNDAKTRWDIQRGASYFFPPEISGAHVGPAQCHTSGRRMPLAYRARVAATRAFGLEMDLNELSAEDRDLLRQAICDYKDNRDLTHGGTLTRLESSDPNVSAEMHIKDDQFLLFAAQLDPSEQQLSRPIRLANLDPNAAYHVQLLNPEDAPVTMNRYYANPIASGITLSAATLMNKGITLPQAFPDTVWVVKGTRQ